MLLVALALGALAALFFALRGCGKAPPDEEEASPQSPEVRMADPEYRRALAAHVAERNALSKTFHSLNAEVKKMVDAARAKLGEGATDEAVKAELEKDPEWRVLRAKVEDVNKAIQDTRRHAASTIRSRIAPDAAQPVSKRGQDK